MSIQSGDYPMSSDSSDVSSSYISVQSEDVSISSDSSGDYGSIPSVKPSTQAWQDLSPATGMGDINPSYLNSDVINTVFIMLGVIISMTIMMGGIYFLIVKYRRNVPVDTGMIGDREGGQNRDTGPHRYHENRRDRENDGINRPYEDDSEDKNDEIYYMEVYDPGQSTGVQDRNVRRKTSESVYSYKLYSS